MRLRGVGGGLAGAVARRQPEGAAAGAVRLRQDAGIQREAQHGTQRHGGRE